MDLIPRSFGFDDLFDNLFLERASEKNTFKCDIFEKDGNYNLEMDLPGIKKEDIKIECEDGYLTISASQDEKKEDATKNYIRKERRYGKYQRSFYVGNIKEDEIKANFENGILSVVVPKEEEKSNKKTIEIN